jgi:hypothetical protein
MFLELCHPTTNKYIPVYSPEVMDLIHQGYSIELILNLSKKIPSKYNRYNLFTNDFLLNYMMHLEIEDIKSLCLVDKDANTLYRDKYIWKLKIDQYLSQVDWFNGRFYVGAYTPKDYLIVIDAVNESHWLYNKKPTFEFCHNENLQLSGEISGLENYNPLLYEVQYISIKETHINISCQSMDNYDKYSFRIVNDNHVKIFIFNILYYFHNVTNIL